MRPAEILARLAAAGITLEVDGTRLLASPRERLTDPLRSLIRQHKPELVKLLTERRREWHITEPNGDAWVSTFAPPQTWAHVLDRYQAGTTAAPVEDPDPADAPLPPDIEAAVTAWLDRIGETCPQTRAEALDLARNRPSVRALYRDMPKSGTPQKPAEGDQGGAP